jgi:hypothetical protein
MDDIYLKLLDIVGIKGIDLQQNNDVIVERDILLSIEKYYEIQSLIPELKKFFSSSYMNCLHKNASENQKWPLLNLVRQVLSSYKLKLIPVRKAHGYTKTGKKLYKRFFLITKL